MLVYRSITTNHTKLIIIKYFKMLTFFSKQHLLVIFNRNSSYAVRINELDHRQSIEWTGNAS